MKPELDVPKIQNDNNKSDISMPDAFRSQKKNNNQNISLHLVNSELWRITIYTNDLLSMFI